MPGRPRVLVTRPAPEAARWVDDLCAAGLDAVALPLIELAPVDAAQAARVARTDPGAYAALMFVSAAAVDGFFKRNEAVARVLTGPSAIDSIATTRFWATGPGTARALQRAGVPPARIDRPAPEAGRFDSETLWALVRHQVAPGTPVLLLRGGDADGQATGRDWLARAVESAGGVVDTLVTYRRLAPTLGLPERALAVDAAADGAIWLFTSSEAIGHLLHALPGVDWSAARAVATHPRIAGFARGAGFGSVRQSAPLLHALVASIESFR